MTNCLYLITVITHAVCLWLDDMVFPREHERDHVGQCLIEGCLPSSIPPDICPAPGPAEPPHTHIHIHTHQHHLKLKTPLLCHVCPSLSFHSFTLSASITRTQWVQLTRGLTSSPRCSPPGDSWDCAQLPRPWRFPLSGMEWEYTQQPTMAPFQDVPCTIKLCSAQYDGLWGSLFGM